MLQDKNISLSPLNGYDGLLPNILTILTYTVSGNEIFIILYFSAENLKLKTENMNFIVSFKTKKVQENYLDFCQSFCQETRGNRQTLYFEDPESRRSQC